MTELLRRTFHSMDKKVLLFPLLPLVLELGVALLGKKTVLKDLWGFLLAGIKNNFRHPFDCNLPVMLDEEFGKAVRSMTQ